MSSIVDMVAYMPDESPEDAGSTDAVEARTEEGRLLARRYRLRRPVGRGGMGTVWQAHDEVLGRDVAVKEVILPYGLSDDERSIQYKRTFREARTAARLGHPGVVTVYDVVEEDGRPWIIMELIRSRSLDQVIKQEGPLPPGRAAEIGRQMLAALHAAHEAGVLHRDVKPSNVLLDSGDRAVLTDFGIATATGDVTLTQTGLVMGSPAYIAPERARGRTIGPASDLWSLGISLYAMVDGKSPYERSEPMASLVAVISEDPGPPANGGSLRPVIEGLLRKDPDERMSAHEAGALLDEIVRAEARASQQTRALELPTEDLLAAQPETRSARTARDEPRVTETEVVPPDPAGAEPVAETAPGPVAETAPGPVAETTAGPPATAPGAEPTRPAASTGRRSAIKITITSIALVIAGIALLALGIVAVRAMSGERNAHSPNTRPSSVPSTKKSSPSASSSPTSSPTRPAPGASGAPEGFRIHHDPTGFSIAVPKGWSGPERRRGGVFFYAPGRGTYIQVDQRTPPGPSALAAWESSAKAGPGAFSGYKEIKVAPVKDGQPVSDASGKKAADWEFTWQSKSGTKHVLDRGFVLNGHGYAILVSAPDDTWAETMRQLAPVYASFTSTG
jgi:serine/threonine protein kinase